MNGCYQCTVLEMKDTRTRRSDYAASRISQHAKHDHKKMTVSEKAAQPKVSDSYVTPKKEARRHVDTTTFSKPSRVFRYPHSIMPTMVCPKPPSDRNIQRWHALILRLQVSPFHLDPSSNINTIRITKTAYVQLLPFSIGLMVHHQAAIATNAAFILAAAAGS